MTYLIVYAAGIASALVIQRYSKEVWAWLTAAAAGVGAAVQGWLSSGAPTP